MVGAGDTADWDSPCPKAVHSLEGRDVANEILDGKFCGGLIRALEFKRKTAGMRVRESFA